MSDIDERHLQNLARLHSVEGRIGALEAAFVEVKGFVQSTDAKLDRLSEAITRMEAQKPQGIKEILTTAAVTASLVAGIIGGIFFLIDARVGSTTAPAVSFARQMTEDGKIYLLFDRVAKLEAAIAWKPQTNTR